ncbi:hypothetical protein Cgig2_016364 [Carnegiea gigantea]|uniref:Uncharacterized protein n=1 Tax=Carnegiea gigantea TaxID=171969 RepID=A0A9Q1Q919_9CARY|nr:hypothetical protein Cgig2_016364 [Carnegiea gigantea]
MWSVDDDSQNHSDGTLSKIRMLREPALNASSRFRALIEEDLEREQNGTEQGQVMQMENGVEAPNLMVRGAMGDQDPTYLEDEHLQARKIHMDPWALVTRHKKVGGIGIPVMRALNAASLMKLRWRMVLEPDKIWARVLSFKYCRGGNLLHTHTPPSVPRHSNTWRGNLEQRRYIEEHAGKALRDGRAARFWLDRWVEPSPLLIFIAQHGRCSGVLKAMV